MLARQEAEIRKAYEEHGSGRGALKFIVAALQWRWSRSQVSGHLRRLGLKIRRKKSAAAQQVHRFAHVPSI